MSMTIGDIFCCFKRTPEQTVQPIPTISGTQVANENVTLSRNVITNVVHITNNAHNLPANRSSRQPDVTRIDYSGPNSIVMQLRDCRNAIYGGIDVKNITKNIYNPSASQNIVGESTKTSFGANSKIEIPDNTNCEIVMSKDLSELVFSNKSNVVFSNFNNINFDNRNRMEGFSYKKESVPHGSHEQVGKRVIHKVYLEGNATLGNIITPQNTRCLVHLSGDGAKYNGPDSDNVKVIKR